MGELGFKGASLDSIFSPLVFSQNFLGEVFSKAFITNDVLNLLLFPLKNSIFITSIIILFSLVIKFKLWDKLPRRLKPISRSNNESKGIIERNPIISAFLSFPIIYITHISGLIIIISLSVFVFLPLNIPYHMGEIAAQKQIEFNNGKVCNQFDWKSEKYKNENIILSCYKIRINDHGDSVWGSVIHSDSKYLYVMTNYFFLRVKDDQVISCVNKQRNQNIKNDIKTTNNEEYQTCDELFGSLKPK